MYKCVISVVTWNSEKYLEKCLDACLQQTLENCKIVVVDNCSTDNTRSIIESYKGSVETIFSDRNTGFSGGHNLAIKSFQAEYYCVLNPDVFLDNKYLQHCISFLDKNNEYGGCIGKVLKCIYKDGIFQNTATIDTCGLDIKKSFQFIAINNGVHDNQDSNKDVFGVDGMCPVYRGSMLNDISIQGEYFDEYFFAYCEDQDLSWRAVNRGWKFAFVNNAIAFHVRTWKPATLKARKFINKDLRKIALRNHYLMLIRNLSFKNFIKASPFILFRVTKIIVYCLFFERYTLRAFAEVASNFKKYYGIRKQIRK